MKDPGFREGAIVALIIATGGALGQSALVWMLPEGAGTRLLIGLLGLAYLIYLLHRSPQRAGRVTTLALWLVAAGLLWFGWPPVSLYLLGHVGLLWLARSLHFHRGPLGALADLALTALALTAALGALLHTGSLFLALWCLFLVQALFVFVPDRGGSGIRGPEEDRFERAHRSAEAAVRQLTAVHR